MNQFKCLTEENARLIALYAEMAKHTSPECACTCRVPYSCCKGHYCEFTLVWAKKHWGV